MARPRHAAGALIFVAAALLAAAPARADSDWPTYGYDSVRTGNNPAETLLRPTTVAGLTQKWSFNAGQFDVSLNASNNPAYSVMRGEAVVASGVGVGGVSTDLLYIGDNNGTFFALDLNGAGSAVTPVWHRSLGAIPITVPRPGNSGVFGTAAVDRTARAGAGAVYVGTNGEVHAMDLATGAELSGWPVAVVEDLGSPTDGRIHTGLNIVNGQIYTTTGANGSDTSPFFGRIVSVDEATAHVSNVWFTLSGNSTRPIASGGGIWGWGGVAIDPTATVGGLYVATGNSFRHTGQLPLYAEQVVNLSPDLTQIVGHATPVWATGDNDYGSTPTVFRPTGCPNTLLAVKNKTGVLVLEGIGPTGKLAVIQTIQAGAPLSDPVGADKYRGTLAWDPATQTLLATNIADGPPPYTHGLTAFKVSSACASPYLSFAWDMSTQTNGQPITPNATDLSSPVVANGVAYFAAGQQTANAYAVALAAGPGVVPGQLLWQSPALTNCTGNSTPTVVNAKLIIPCGGGASPMLYVFGLPGH